MKISSEKNRYLRASLLNVSSLKSVYTAFDPRSQTADVRYNQSDWLRAEFPMRLWGWWWSQTGREIRGGEKGGVTAVVAREAFQTSLIGTETRESSDCIPPLEGALHSAADAVEPMNGCHRKQEAEPERCSSTGWRFGLWTTKAWAT